MHLKVPILICLFCNASSMCIASSVAKDSIALPNRATKYDALKSFQKETLEAFVDSSRFDCDTTQLMAKILIKAWAVSYSNQEQADRNSEWIDSTAQKLQLPTYRAFNRLLSIRTLIIQEKYYEARDELLEILVFFEKNKNFKYLDFYDPEYRIHYNLLTVYWIIHDNKRMAEEAEWCIEYNKKKYLESDDFLDYQVALYLYLFKAQLPDPSTPHSPERDSLFEAYDKELARHQIRFKEKGLDLLKKDYAPYNYHQYIQFLKGYHYLRAGRTDEAKRLYDLLSKTLTGIHNTSELRVLFAEISYALGDIEMAKSIYSEARRNNSRLSSFVLLENLWGRVAEMYAAEGNIDSFKSYRNLRDSILLLKQNKARVYALNKKEKTTLIKNHKVWIWVAILLLLLIGTIIGVRYFPHFFMDRLAFLSVRSRVERDERKRLSGELHDNVAPMLTGINLWLSSKYNQSEDIEIKEIMKYMDKALHEVRNLSHELKDPEVTQLDITEILQNYIELLKRQKKTTINAHIDDSLPSLELSDVEKITILRILQEILYNIFKHAHATQVDINLNFYGNTLNLIIEDNGIGFDVETLLQDHNYSSRIGLKSSIERAISIDGKLSIESSEGHGSVFIFSKPLQ